MGSGWTSMTRQEQTEFSRRQNEKVKKERADVMYEFLIKDGQTIKGKIIKRSSWSITIENSNGTFDIQRRLITKAIRI